MFSFFQQLLGSSPQPGYSERAELLAQIKQTLHKLDQAWRNFSFAQPEFIDVAIMDIHNAENELGVLIAKLRLITADHKKSSRSISDNPRSQFRWLVKKDLELVNQEPGC